jgi:hypothetical protein
MDQPQLSKQAWRWRAMKKYRFVTVTHYEVAADNLEEAIQSFNQMKRQRLCLEVETVSRIEVQDEKGEYVTVDRPLRAGDLDFRHEAQRDLPI